MASDLLHLCSLRRIDFEIHAKILLEIARERERAKKFCPPEGEKGEERAGRPVGRPT